jgi:hypothetical protein
MSAKSLILQHEPELVGDMLPDLRNFIAHAKLDEDLGRYLQTVLVTAAQHIENLPAFEHPLPLDFAFMSKDYSFDDPFVSFMWECRNFNPNVVWIGQFGDEKASRKAEETVQRQRQAQDALAETLNAIPHPEVVKHIEVGEEQGNLGVQILFKQDIFDDAWESGGPGYSV